MTPNPPKSRKERKPNKVDFALEKSLTLQKMSKKDPHRQEAIDELIDLQIKMTNEEFLEYEERGG